LSDDAELNYSNYLEFCDRLSDEIKRNEGKCSSCQNIKFDIYEKEQFINEINISPRRGYDICNAKCSYCSGFKAESQDNLEKRKVEVINTLKFFETHFPKKNFTVSVASGEISIEPYEDELFDIIDKNGWNATIMTNGSIYSERVAKALLNSKSSALITLDSTVPEVYSKIKGINCLDKVLKNICEYNKYGRVNVKWIALEQTYTSFEQIKGIVDFVSDNNIDLCISHDSYSIDKVMSEELKDLTYKFICYAMDKAVKFNIIYDHFHREDSEHLKLFVKNMKKGCE
jgi:pyruvate-formate lyase-activating enzyme